MGPLPPHVATFSAQKGHSISHMVMEVSLLNANSKGNALSPSSFNTRARRKKIKRRCPATYNGGWGRVMYIRAQGPCKSSAPRDHTLSDFTSTNEGFLVLPLDHGNHFPHCWLPSIAAHAEASCLPSSLHPVAGGRGRQNEMIYSGNLTVQPLNHWVGGATALAYHSPSSPRPPLPKSNTTHRQPPPNHYCNEKEIYHMPRQGARHG